ncbi:MAG: hypothetical protein Q4G34_01150 [Micrococcus sp.]|nr:hypothetical protein [Micrococcus sp.]
MPQGQKVAVVDGELVGMVTSDRRVALIGDAGETRWTVALPDGEVHSPLTLTYADDVRVLAIHVGSRLAWWSVDDAAAGGVDLPAEDSPISWRGDTPLVGVAGDRVGMIQDGQLVELPVPAGARAVSAWADGHVIAASADGWWRLTPGAEPGEVTPWDTPEAEPAQATVIDAIGPYVVTLQVAGDDQVLAVVHMDTGQRVSRLMSGVLPGVAPGEALTWRPSSSRSWGILGHAIVDMEASSVTDLGSPWTTEHVIADRAMGTLAGQRVIVSPDAPRGVMRDGESFPEEVLGVNALVRGRDPEGAERVWLLPPNPDIPTVQLTTPATGG